MANESITKRISSRSAQTDRRRNPRSRGAAAIRTRTSPRRTTSAVRPPAPPCRLLSAKDSSSSGRAGDASSAAANGCAGTCQSSSDQTTPSSRHQTPGKPTSRARATTRRAKTWRSSRITPPDSIATRLNLDPRTDIVRRPQARPLHRRQARDHLGRLLRRANRPRAPSWPSPRTPRARTSSPTLATSRSTTSTRSSPACPRRARSRRLEISTGTPVAEHIRTGYTAERQASPGYGVDRPGRHADPAIHHPDIAFGYGRSAPFEL